MKHLALLLAVAACSPERQSEERTVAPAPATLPAPQAQKNSPPVVFPKPGSQAELDRMILAGYTPHGKHLHPPGVKTCPFAQGSEAVM